jgi:class 3 adenylate cyclase
MECPSCKADVPDGSKFCNDCGAAVPFRCVACGAQNRAGSKFCSECGASLAAPTAGSLAAAPTAASAQQPIPSPERRQLTVMFVDLVGSTALSARLDPEELRDIIGTYHRRCAEVITGSGGFVAKYLGDGVLAYFGYPQAHEEDAEQAVRAGLALIEAVAKLDGGQATWLQARIGIATGLVVVGDLLGEGAAQEQAVIGETPNLAARLQGLAEPNTVVIADDTRRMLGGLFDYRDLGTLPVAGIDYPVHVWRVLGASLVGSRFEALRAASTPLIGREEEIALLTRRWERAKAGDGSVVLIVGEPGIGKSRIAQTCWSSWARSRTRGCAFSARHIISTARFIPASPSSSRRPDFDARIRLRPAWISLWRCWLWQTRS